jgi:hypothetical protein
MGCKPWTNCNFFEEVNNNLKSPLKISIVKEKHVMNASAISNFFGAINPYKKSNAH